MDSENLQPEDQTRKAPLPDEALEGVAGGYADVKSAGPTPYACPECGTMNDSYKTEYFDQFVRNYYICSKCGEHYVVDSGL